MSSAPVTSMLTSTELVSSREVRGHLSVAGREWYEQRQALAPRIVVEAVHKGETTVQLWTHSFGTEHPGIALDAAGVASLMAALAAVLAPLAAAKADQADQGKGQTR